MYEDGVWADDELAEAGWWFEETSEEGRPMRVGLEEIKGRRAEASGRAALGRTRPRAAVRTRPQTSSTCFGPTQ